MPETVQTLKDGDKSVGGHTYYQGFYYDSLYYHPAGAMRFFTMKNPSNFRDPGYLSEDLSISDRFSGYMDSEAAAKLRIRLYNKRHRTT